MAIFATDNGTKRELIPSNMYVARCYQMIHIGTVEETIENQPKTLNKVRIGFELPTLKKVFNEEKGEQPYVISKEFTLSLNEKATLRKFLDSWRGLAFTEIEAKSFDVTKLLGKPCMLNIIQKKAKNGIDTFNEIASVSQLMKDMPITAQINQTILLDYDNFDRIIFDSLPDFIKNKMKTSKEYEKLIGEAYVEETATNLVAESTKDGESLSF